MVKLLYFAYGSNMSTPRLVSRVPSANVVATASLEGHRLRFHKKSITGSGKCDIENTKNPEDLVWGIVFEILETEKPLLDVKEGLGEGYDDKWVSVVKGDGEVIDVFTYYATIIDSSLKPFSWYKEHVLRGAEEHSLPSEYIKTIQAVESFPDPDLNNHEDELSIYR